MPLICTGIGLAALAYAKRGIHVFPVAHTKAPLTPSGFKDATTDREQIRAWWAERPDAWIGIAAGASGLVVIDVDCKRQADGFETIKILERELGPLGTTRKADTPSGGRHYYFRGPSTLKPSVGRVEGNPAPGVDVRAGGSYVVAPPSPGYAWRTPRAVTAQALPQRWVDALSWAPPAPPAVEPPPPFESESRARAYCLAAMRDEARKVAELGYGVRNETLNERAFLIGTLIQPLGLTFAEAERALQWACSQWSNRNPSKDTRTLRRALRDGSQSPRDLRLAVAS